MFSTLRAPIRQAAKSRLFSTNAAPSYTPSIWENLFNKSKYPRTPLSHTFPNVPELSSQPLPTLKQDASVSTLSNGLRVASLPSHSPVAAVGVFVDAGSRYEDVNTAGHANFLEIMSLKTTHNRSDFRLVREMAKMGAGLHTTATREGMSYWGESLKEYVPALIGTFGDLIQHHKFHIEEVMEEKELYEEAHAERSGHIGVAVEEGLFEVAYGSNTLGRSLMASLKDLDNISPESLKAYQYNFFTPKRMVIAGVGVEHEELVQMVRESFDSLGPDVSHPKEKAVYQGGEWKRHHREMGGENHVILAFEGASFLDKDFVPLCVLQTLLGGGGSFSAGGPGKGMYSRLYTNLLNKFEWVANAQAFAHPFSDTSLFGLYGITHDPTKVKNLAEELSKELIKTTGSMESAELARAKTQVKNQMLYTLDTRFGKLEEVGRGLLVQGRVKSVSEMQKEIDAVTAEDVQRIARKMLATPLTVSAAGDLSNLPRYEQLQRLFK